MALFAGALCAVLCLSRAPASGEQLIANGKPAGMKMEFGNVQNHKDGFTIHGNSRAYFVKNAQVSDWWSTSYETFDLRGKTVSYTADLSKVGCGCAATLYFVKMGAPGAGPNYCDIQPNHGWAPCFEVDLMEANMMAFHSSLHTQQGDAHDGTCNAVYGCTTNFGRYPYTRFGQRTKDIYGPGAMINTKRPFKVIIAFDQQGSMDVILEQGEMRVPGFNQSSAGNFAKHDPWDLKAYPVPGGLPKDAIVASAAAFGGGVTLVASLWEGGSDPKTDTHWLDNSACGGKKWGSIGGASFTVSDLKIEDGIEKSDVSNQATDLSSEEMQRGIDLSSEEDTASDSDMQFHPQDGGTDRACRGDDPSDNDASYYKVFLKVKSASACRDQCLKLTDCRGIEYYEKFQRCEVWTRSIKASSPVVGCTCLRRQPMDAVQMYSQVRLHPYLTQKLPWASAVCAVAGVAFVVVAVLVGRSFGMRILQNYDNRAIAHSFVMPSSETES